MLNNRLGRGFVVSVVGLGGALLMGLVAAPQTAASGLTIKGSELIVAGSAGIEKSDGTRGRLAVLGYQLKDGDTWLELRICVDGACEDVTAHGGGALEEDEGAILLEMAVDDVGMVGLEFWPRNFGGPSSGCVDPQMGIAYEMQSVEREVYPAIVMGTVGDWSTRTTGCGHFARPGMIEWMAMG